MTDRPDFEVRRDDGHVVSTNRSRLDLNLIHRWIRDESYWAKGIPFETVERAIANSLPFGLYAPDGTQLGFARVTTDRATFAYLQDVFVLVEARGRGLGVWLVEQLMAHPDLQGLRRWMLATRDAHTLYEKFGFKPLEEPSRFMQRHDPNIYLGN